MKSEHEKVILSRDKKIAEAEKRTRDKESQVSTELSKNKKLNHELEVKKKDYDQRTSVIENDKKNLTKCTKAKCNNWK